MEKTPEIISTRSPMEEMNFSVVTSTPRLRSDVGRKLIRKFFIQNMPKDISLLESQIENMKIEEKSLEKSLPEVEQEVKEKPFVFSKQETSPYAFNPPQSISSETIERYAKLFAETPKLKRKRIRL